MQSAAKRLSKSLAERRDVCRCRSGRSGGAAAADRRGDQGVRQARRHREQRRLGRAQRSRKHRRRVLRPDDGHQRAGPAAADPSGLSALESSREGCVLNIGSINAYCGESNLLAYSISKGALMTLSRNLADALCYDRFASTTSTSAGCSRQRDTRQKIADGLPPDWPEHVEPQFAPSGRIMPPEKIAAAAVYWLSRRKPADQRQRGRAGAVPDDRPQSHRRKATDAATGRVPQGVHGRAVRRRHDDAPRVDRAGRDARHRRPGVLHAVSRACRSRRSCGRARAHGRRSRTGDPDALLLARLHASRRGVSPAADRPAKAAGSTCAPSWAASTAACSAASGGRKCRAKTACATRPSASRPACRMRPRAASR